MAAPMDGEYTTGDRTADALAQAEKARLKGNSAFRGKDYRAAVDAYTDCLEKLLTLRKPDINGVCAASDELTDPGKGARGYRNVPSQLAVVYSNRSAANNSAGYFANALQDAEEAVNYFSRPVVERDAELECSEAAAKRQHLLAKAHYRRGKALCSLRRYAEGLIAYEEAGRLSLDPAEATTEVERTTRHLAESRGNYDFPSLWHEARKRPNVKLYDHVDFVGPVEIASDVGEGKGRGLVTTEDVEPGTLLLACKAVALVYDSEVFDDQKIVNRNPGLMRQGVKKELQRRIIDAVSRNEFLLNETRILSSANNLSDSSSALGFATSRNQHEKEAANTNLKQAQTSEHSMVTCVEEPPSQERDPVSSKSEPEFVPRLSGIITKNASDLSIHPLSLKDNPICGTSDVAAGLWTLPSLVNHACIGNVNKFTIGDYVFIRALRRIRKGKEVLFPYCDALEPLHKREEAIRQLGFQCHCAMCEMERKEPENLTAQRKRLWEEFRVIEPRLRNEEFARKPHNEINRIVEAAHRDFLAKRENSATLARLPYPNGLLYRAANARALYYAAVGPSRALDAAESFALAAKALAPVGVHPLSDSTAYHAAQAFLTAGKFIEAAKWFTAAVKAWNIAYGGDIEVMRAAYSGTPEGERAFAMLEKVLLSYNQRKLQNDEHPEQGGDRQADN